MGKVCGISAEEGGVTKRSDPQVKADAGVSTSPFDPTGPGENPCRPTSGLVSRAEFSAYAAPAPGRRLF